MLGRLHRQVTNFTAHSAKMPSVSADGVLRLGGGGLLSVCVEPCAQFVEPVTFSTLAQPRDRWSFTGVLEAAECGYRQAGNLGGFLLADDAIVRENQTGHFRLAFEPGRRVG